MLRAPPIPAWKGAAEPLHVTSGQRQTQGLPITQSFVLYTAARVILPQCRSKHTPVENSAGEYLLWLSRLRTQLVFMRIQIRSLVSLNGLRIQCCRELWHRSKMWLRPGVAVPVAVAVAGSCSSDSTPSLGTSICCRCGLKKKKDKKKKKSLLGLSWHQNKIHILTMTYSLGIRKCGPQPRRGRVGRGEVLLEMQNLRSHSRLAESEATSLSH